jgi:hypothetical protein
MVIPYLTIPQSNPETLRSMKIPGLAFVNDSVAAIFGEWMLPSLSSDLLLGLETSRKIAIINAVNPTVVA